ncbi:MAG: DUF6472 family protein [Oscillospiraceae bacterium]|nr:DUF6472 family protein [Clostridiaceae bacterium]MDO4494167.1 DUF6472 family protein [Clostridiaceae bacterium]MDY5949086.1 DUF6472 family protein [Oscillospiraceae bacterium]
MAGSTICDNCAHYDYNEEYECYECLVDLDEDELYRFMSGSETECPYFDPYDEYKIVRKQN